MPADVQLVQSVSAGFLIILLFVNHRSIGITGNRTRTSHFLGIPYPHSTHTTNSTHSTNSSLHTVPPATVQTPLPRHVMSLPRRAKTCQDIPGTCQGQIHFSLPQPAHQDKNLPSTQFPPLV
ncbi:hypothetical protein AO438_000461 [Nakaseomyces glabratus]|nr:hypothetical protein AO438_000461 [Nakaseomyces glabratus]